MKKLFTAAFVALFAACLMSCSSEPKVTLIEDVETYTMDNGIISVRVSKASGDLVSFRFHGKEMFATTLQPDFIPAAHGDTPADNPNWKDFEIGGRAHGYWSHDVIGVRGSAPAIPTITIDPSKNGGKIAEVSIKAISKDRKMGTGPGTNPREGDLQVDIEIRYTLERGSAGVYTYCIFDHPAGYEYAAFGEARYCAKLNDSFDWISVDKNVNKYFPKDLREGDKYVYTAPIWDNPAFGWSSTTDSVGMFFINPSMEYMSGGPTKVEFMGHRNTTREAEPCILNYWRSSHYGGAEANMAAGEVWNKIIGPFMIYANKGTDPEAIYADARAQAAKEQAKWPYSWVKNVDYPVAEERATVKGKFTLEDPLVSGDFSGLMVGVGHASYGSPRPDGSQGAEVTWQRDAKFYQFWAKGNADGTFEVSKVRPGKYTLYAFTDGVMGEYTMADVVLEKGQTLDLGELKWTPVRKGRQVWQVGLPNRKASEFFMADQHRDPSIPLKYAELFPNDITFTIGKNDVAKDWFFMQVPHNLDPEPVVTGFSGISSKSTRATPYTVVFDLPQAPAGKAILRFAICGTSTRSVDITVNGKEAGKLTGLPGDNVIARHGSSGIWYERDFEFDASLLKAGANELAVIVPEGSMNNGMVYDCIRLEIAE